MRRSSAVRNPSAAAVSALLASPGNHALRVLIILPARLATWSSSHPILSQRPWIFAHRAPKKFLSAVRASLLNLSKAASFAAASALAASAAGVVGVVVGVRAIRRCGLVF